MNTAKCPICGDQNNSAGLEIEDDCILNVCYSCFAHWVTKDDEYISIEHKGVIIE